MWTMTPWGFTSAVAHRKKKDSLLIRSRDRKSLENLCIQAGIPERKIHTNFPSDYPFRVIVKREVAAQWAYDQMMGVDYDNFKSRAAKCDNSKGFVSFLHDIWTAGLKLTPADVRAKNWSAWDAYDRKHGFGKYAPPKAENTSRWSRSGAWGSYWGWTGGGTGATENPLTDVNADDEIVDYGWTDPRKLSVSQIVEMQDEERLDAIADLQFYADKGDLNAETLLDEIETLLPEMPLDEDVSMYTSIQSMTDEEFARFEAGKSSIG